MSARDEAKPDLAADRLVYFSDAVVAIAITLLVLPLVELVPEVRETHESVRDIILGNQGPILAFLLSFVVIARLWMLHHALFDGVERVDRRLIWVDMVWLLTIVVLPFPTALTGSTSDDPLTARLYVAVLAVNLLTLTALATLVHRARADPDDRSWGMAWGVGTSAGLVVVGFVILLIVPQVGFGVLLLLFVGGLVESAVRRVLRRRSSAP